jgi:D-alanyl-D-alanine carboxypeptidase (penicillin-binding protein 5/6)
MNRFRKIFFILLSIVFFPVCQTCSAAAPASASFQVDAKSAVLINGLTGKIVFEQNPDEKIAPASLIKIMTLYLVYDALDGGNFKLSDIVTISKRAWKFGGSQMFLEVGMQVPLREIIKGIAVVSGNDACVAAAEDIAGMEETFVEKMNKKAAEIGMANTSIKNCHGLPAEGQHTTARDMALLSYHYIKDHPRALEIHSTKEMTFNNITQQNRNKLLWRDPSVDGLKTGWIRESGYHLVATAHRNNDRYIAVIMGAQSHFKREEEALKLLNYGFRNFKTVPLVDAAKPLATIPVKSGIENQVQLGVLKTSFVTVPREQAAAVQIETDAPSSVTAPVAKHQQIGTVKALVNGSAYATVPLVALAPVERAGFIKIALQTISHSFITAPYWGFILLGILFIVLLLVRSLSKGKNKDKRGTSFLS